MKSLLIFLAMVAATFAWPTNSADERHPAPNPLPFNVPQYLYEDINTNIAAKKHHRHPDHSHQGQNVFKAGRIYLILGNNNLFLTAGPRIGIELYIQSIQLQQDESCHFAVSILESGKVAFRSFGGDGAYLQLNPGRTPGVNSIRPISNVINDSTQFEVEVSHPGPWDGAHYVHLKAENGKYWGIVQEPVEDNIAADYEDRVEDTRLIVLEAL